MVFTGARRVFRALRSGMLWPAIVVFVLVAGCVVFLPGPAGRPLGLLTIEQQARARSSPR